MFGGVFHGKQVWLSGHTGFKGSWLATWLLRLGARVHGFALEPPTSPSLFEQLGLEAELHHEIGDIRDAARVAASIREAQPDFVFHLAAQPLVRLSYREPVATFDTNVMGTVHVLDALRDLARHCAAIIVTTDKCYENREWLHGYREEDPLGGYDPYSSSKAAAEIATAAYRRSFFNEPDGPIQVASARAGNVIGGGDWAEDRIVPDCVRALSAGRAIPVRNKAATRPWQHVLEPLSGYLWLAACLARPELAKGSRRALASAFNFGPRHESNRTVVEVVEQVLQQWPGTWDDRSDSNAVHEASLLQLSTDKAHALLGWAPVWDFPESISRTVAWYRAAEKDGSAAQLRELTAEQIRCYGDDAAKSQLPWACS